METNDDTPPSLVQRYQQGNLSPLEASQDDQNGDQSALTKATKASESLSLSLTSPSPPSSSSPDLLTLRSASHSLSSENKDAKSRVAAMKAKVDEARLQLENRRLEERELMEEIRRESGE